MQNTNIVSQKLPTQTALYQEVVKEIKEDPQHWGWVQSIYSKALCPKQSSSQNNNLKKIKKTQAYQIGYKIEDLEQQIRRLTKNVDVVKQCNVSLKSVLSKEQKQLKNLEDKMNNAKAFSVKGDKGQLSMNLMRNLEREYCSVLSNIRIVNSKIQKLKQSPEYFEFKENYTLVCVYQQQITNLENISKDFEFENKKKILESQEKLKQKISSQKKKVKWLCQHLQDLEQQLMAKEIGNHQSIFQKEFQNLQKQNQNLKIKLSQLQKEVKENDQKLKDKKNEKKILKYTMTINKKLEKFLDYLSFYQSIFNLDDFYIEEISSDLIKDQSPKQIIQILKDSFDIPQSYIDQIKEDKQFLALICSENLQTLSQNLKIFQYNKDILEETIEIKKDQNLLDLICKQHKETQQLIIHIFDVYQYNQIHNLMTRKQLVEEIKNLMDQKNIKNNRILLNNNIKKIKLKASEFTIKIKLSSNSNSSNSNKKETKIKKEHTTDQKIEENYNQNIQQQDNNSQISQQQNEEELRQMIDEVDQLEKCNNYYDYFDDNDSQQY